VSQTKNKRKWGVQHSCGQGTGEREITLTSTVSSCNYCHFQLEF